MLEEAITLCVEGTLEDIRPIPDPISERRYTGRLSLRLSPFLHEQAATRSELEQTSPNRVVTNTVETHLGQKLRPYDGTIQEKIQSVDTISVSEDRSTYRAPEPEGTSERR